MKLAASILGISGLMGTTALAADLATAPAYIDDVVSETGYDAPGFDWTGFYVGFQGGHTVGDSQMERALAFPVPDSLYTKSYDPAGGFLGLHASYLFQLDNNLVVGVEGDWNWSSAEGVLFPETAPLPPFTIDGTSTLSSEASIRAKLGYALDRTLIYVTAGVGFADYEFTYNVPTALLATTDSFQGTGYTVGVGLAQAFTDNIVGHVEYRYSDYGSQDLELVPMNPASGPGTINLRTHNLSAGVSLKF